MKNPVVCILAPIILLTLFSCQKELDFPPGAAIDPDTLLNKIIVVDSLNPQKDVLNIDYIYDHQQRVTKIITYDINTVGQFGYTTLHDSTTFEYQSNDRLPYRSKGYSRLLQSWEIETWHRYTVINGRDLLAADSVPLGDGVSYARRSLSYTDKIIARSEFWVTGALIDEFSDTFYLTGGNIERAVFSSIPSAGGLYFVNNFDNHVNPLTKMNIRPLLVIDGCTAYDKMMLIAPGYCSNNIINRRGSYTFPMTNTENQAYTFTYLDNGLPQNGKYESNKETTRQLYMRYYYFMTNP